MVRRIQFRQEWNKLSDLDKNSLVCSRIFGWAKVECACTCGCKEMWVDRLHGGSVIRPIGCVGHATPNFVGDRSLAVSAWERIGGEAARVAHLSAEEIAFEALCWIAGCCD